MKQVDKEYLKKQSSIIITLYNTKKYEKAAEKGKILIKKYPSQIVFYNATALSLSALGKYVEALKILKSALFKFPNNIFVLNNLGLINSNIGKTKLSREYYEKAISINNKFIDALVNLGNLDLKENKIENSKQNYYQALSLSNSPQTDEIINNALGMFHQQTGNFEESIKHFQIVNKINPLDGTSDKSISTIHKYKNEDDPHYISMKKKIALIKEKGALKPLYFALAKASEDLKKYKESFKYLALGNSIANEEANYKIDQDQDLFNSIKRLFKNFDINQKIDSDKKIIFIVGMPRSGTTLVEQIISSHKNVYGAGELSFMSDAIENFSGMEMDSKISLSDKFKNIKELNLEELKNIQLEYADKLKTLNFNEQFITDKAPLNFRWIGFIRTVFPNSKIIHCNRDPMDTCYSNFKNSFGANSLGFSYDLKKLGKYYNLYKDLTNFWTNIYTKDIYQFSYEKLVNEKENEVKKLLNFCGLEWDKNCLEPHKNTKSVATASLSQVRSPIYNSSINKWKNYETELGELKKIIL